MHIIWALYLEYRIFQVFLYLESFPKLFLHNFLYCKKASAKIILVFVVPGHTFSCFNQYTVSIISGTVTKGALLLKILRYILLIALLLRPISSNSQQAANFCKPKNFKYSYEKEYISFPKNLTWIRNIAAINKYSLPHQILQESNFDFVGCWIAIQQPIRFHFTYKKI